MSQKIGQQDVRSTTCSPFLGAKPIQPYTALEKETPLSHGGLNIPPDHRLVPIRNVITGRPSVRVLACGDVCGRVDVLHSKLLEIRTDLRASRKRFAAGDDAWGEGAL